MNDILRKSRKREPRGPGLEWLYRAHLLTPGTCNGMGFEARAFERAEDFLRSHQIARADCLITDVRMPGMNGLELLDRLLAAGKSIPAIVLTAFTQEADRVRALGAGAVCYMPKPFHESELMKCIGAALSSGSL